MLFKAAKNAGRHLACGIDIGTHTIKLVALEQHEAGLAFRHAARVATPADTIQDDVIVKPRLLAACIQQMVHSAKLPLRSASFSIPVEQITVKWISLPRMSRSDLRAAAAFEATKFLPYPVENADLGIVASEDVAGDESGSTRALLVAAPRAVARTRAETLEMAGLSVVGAELESFAILRTLRESEGAPSVLWRGQSVAYVQLGHRVSNLCVLQDTDLRFVRGIAWGGERLTQALALQIGCDTQAAQEIKERADSTIDENGVFYWNDTNNANTRRQTEAFLPELDRLRPRNPAPAQLLPLAVPGTQLRGHPGQDRAVRRRGRAERPGRIFCARDSGRHQHPEPTSHPGRTAPA